MVGASGYLLDHGVNDSVIAVNRLLAAGHEVYWLDESITATGIITISDFVKRSSTSGTVM